MARPLLALGGLVLVGVGLVAGFGWGWASADESDTTLPQAIRSVRLDGDAGSVRIRTGSGPATVHQELSYHFRSKPGDAFRVEGDQLVLGDCGDNCTASYEIVVPAGLPVTGKVDSGSLDIVGAGSVDVQSDSGSAKIADVPGTVKLQLDSGSLEVQNVGPVQLRSDSGSVKGSGLRGPADVTADSGSVTLSLADANDVKVHASSGSVDLTVPSGSYRVTGSSDSGHRRIDVTEDPSAAKTLDLNTDSGSVRVHAA